MVDASLYFVIEPLDGASVLGVTATRRDGEAMADRLRVERNLGAWSARFWSERAENRMWTRSISGPNGSGALELVRLDIDEPAMSEWLAAVNSGSPARAAEANDKFFEDATESIHRIWDSMVDDDLSDSLGAIAQVLGDFRRGEVRDGQGALSLLDVTADWLSKIDTDRYPKGFTSDLAAAVSGLADALRTGDMDAAVGHAKEMSDIYRDNAEFLAWLAE